MTAFFDLVLSGSWQLLIWGPVLAATVAATVFAVRQHAGPDPAARASDSLFWDLFMGSAVAVPAILIPTLATPWTGLVLAAVGGAAGVAAYRSHPRIVAWQSRRQQRRTDLPVLTAAQAEHAALVARWSRYELDPALCIDFPAMTDIRQPETAAVIRAMRDANQLRAVPHQGYATAVARLRLALTEAEKAAGIPAATA